MIKSIISNGSYKFHLAPLASELSKTGELAAFFTAGYPKGWLHEISKKIPNKGMQRLVNRRENIPDELVYAFNYSELFFKTGDLLLRKISQEHQQRIHIKGFESYSRSAQKVMSKIDFDIYHYRDCYGLQSAEFARSIGKKTVCDHSIGHPYAISYLLNNPEESLPTIIPPQPLSILEKQYLIDFNYADYILVNSDFVKETFVASGFPASKIYVIYWGIDTQFLSFSDKHLQNRGERKKEKDLLFCGDWGKRKGVLQLMEALEKLENEDWTLTIAGGINNDVAFKWDTFYKKFKSRITFLGVLTRDELAKLMSLFQIFIFPSLMEGSARVVFEALASGC